MKKKFYKVTYTIDGHTYSKVVKAKNKEKAADIFVNIKGYAIDDIKSVSEIDVNNLEEK